MQIPNLFKSFWYKKTGRFGMAKNGHSELFKHFSYKKTGRNLKWPKLGIPNLCKSVMVCKGLESNEICTFLGF